MFNDCPSCHKPYPGTVTYVTFEDRVEGFIAKRKVCPSCGAKTTVEVKDIPKKR